ncbi:MAG: GAF domain-containing protein [Desulfobacteraceae bacterium]|jgi:signal transduction protein with GAF and PtsI domain
MEDTQLQYFRLFRDVSKAVNSSLDVAEVLKLITENTTSALDVKACTIFLLDKDRKVLEARASHGLSESYLKKGPVEADKSISGSLKGKTVLIYSVKNDPRAQYPKEAEKEGIASILSIPVTVKGEIIGVLRIYTSEPRKFSYDEIEFIYGVADMGGIAIDNARMYHHLKSDHERLIQDVHQFFEFGSTP